MNEWDREKRPVKNRGVGKRKHTPPNEKSDCRNDRIARRLKTVQSAMPTQPAPHIGAGWSLQVVPRRCGKQKDTYYFSPSGARLRSMPEVRRYLERGLVNSVESPKKAVPVANANNASDEGKSSLEFGSERPLKKIPAHRLIIGYTAKKETAETDSKRRREVMLMESLEHRRILLRNVKAGRLAAERNLDGKLAGGYAWDSASPPTLDTKTRLEREKAVFYDEMSAAAELDAPPRLCKRVRGSSRETDSDEDFELVQEDEDDSQSDDEDSVESEGLEGFDALASAAADAADEEPRIPVRRTRWESMWEEKFNELVEFKKVHGHCDVKQRSKNNTELGRFVKKMREYKNKYDKQQYNGSVLTPSRIARLDELGFTWNRRDGQHIKSFDDRMQELAAFKAEHGHADIPRSLEDNMSLARWAHVVRQSYRQIQKGGKPALALTREMIERLEAIGFRLRVKERGKIKQVPFEERLRSLAEFKDVHGHVNVGDDSNLARFCNQMRVARRAPQPGVTMKLTQDRISALDALGFEWEPQKKKRRKARRDIMTAQYDDEETSAVHRPVLVPGDFQPASLFCDWLGERKSKWKHSRDRPRKDPPLESDQTPTRPQEFHNSGRKRRRKYSDARDNMTAQYDDEESSAVHRLVLVPGSCQPASLFCDWLEDRKSKWKHSRVRPRNPPLGTDQTSTNVRGRLLSGRKRRRMHSDDGAPMIDTCAHPRRSERILELKRFFDEHGKLPTPQSDKGLSLFCYSLRSEFKLKKDMLSPQDLNILDEIGFWVSKTSTSDASKRIVELKHFYDEHGKLPTQQSNRSLYEFGRNLRNKYKHKKDMLSPQDLNVLNEIDFWVCKTSVASKRILELKQFYDEHGELPTNRSNKSLCIFGRNLRNKYKHKKDSLSRQDLDTLEEIGFRVSKTPSACERILVLKRFVDEHGELPTQQSNKSLYIFCRNLRKKQSEGKLSLSRQDMEILDEIGFRWGRAKSNSTSSGTDTPRRISEQILELKRFFDKHGKLPTPKSNKSLATFCYKLRNNGKDRLSPQDLETLREIGFRWESKTTSRLNELKLHFDEHGHFDVSTSENSGLARYVANIRSAYNNWDGGTTGSATARKISDNTISELTSMGFTWGRSRPRPAQQSFESRIEDLKKYKQQHGHLKISREEDQSLFDFCNNVRYGRNHPGRGMVMTEERVKALDEIGFTWAGTREAGWQLKSTGAKNKQKCSKSFESRVEDLKKFKQQHGHLNISREEDQSLFDFCTNIRYGRRNPDKGMTVTDERAKALDEIGFSWATSGTRGTRTEANKAFESRLADLRQYKQQHGHLNISRKEDQSLYNFCQNVRTGRNNPDGGGMKITGERIKALDKIGFPWARKWASTRGTRTEAKNANGRFKSFESRIEDLKKFKQRNGHLNISREEDQSLFYFCHNVRYSRSNPDKFKGMAVSDDRIKALDEIGFSWAVARKSGKAKSETSFESRLADLRQYKQQHGHLNVKQEEDGSLYYFCQIVRTGRNNPSARGMQITDERVRALDEIGFPWGGMKTFEERLDELRKYKRLHGHMNVRWADDISLAAFCSKLRFARKTKKTTRLNLTDAKIAALDSIGFDWF